MRFLGEVDVTEEEERKMKEKVKNMKSPLDYYSKWIAPDLVGIDEKKKAIMLSICSMYDRDGKRRRVHSFLYGPPGVGKSAILKWLRDNLGIGFASKKTTEAGLIGDMSHGKPSRGKLPKNHMGVCGIDEIDKMGKGDREGLLECMSDGRVTLTGGEVDESFKANTIILAIANNKEKLEKQLINRFDFKLEFDYYDREEHGREIIRSNIRDASDMGLEREKLKELKKYLKIVRSFEPKLKNEEKVEEILEEFLKINNIKKVDPREHVDRISRLGKVYGRINLRDPDARDYVKAIEMFFQNKYPKLRRMYGA